MKRAEFVTMVAEQTGVTKKQAERVIDATFSCLGDVLAQGDKLTWTGFGAFETRQRAAREGHMPSTGERIEIPATNVAVFKPSKQLKEKLKQL